MLATFTPPANKTNTHSPAALNRATLGVIAAIATVITCPIARAADYTITATGPFSRSSSLSDTFDGTNRGTLPTFLEIDRLAGGTFRSSYRFSTTAPNIDFDSDPNTAYYDLADLSSSLTFELFDSTGQTVHKGSQFFGAEAFVFNNSGVAPFIVDQIGLSTLVTNTTNIRTPAALYSTTADTFSLANIRVFGDVSAEVDFITDVQIPIDPATYLAFPNRIFTIYNTFGDGDYFEGILPFQYAEEFIDYSITSLTITPVPEATAIYGLAPVLAGLTLRRRHPRTR